MDSRAKIWKRSEWATILPRSSQSTATVHVGAYNPNVMRAFVAVAFTLVASCACGCKHSELDSFHSNWKKLPLSPLAGSSYLRQAETSPCTWNVQTNGDRITIQRVSMRSIQRPDELQVQFAGGRLIGEDRGEWGGSLSVLEDGNRTPREILGKNVLQMFPMHDGAEVITGDLLSNNGSAWFYSNAPAHGWVIQKKADLHGYPTVIGKSGERTLFAYGDAVSIMENFNERQIAALPLLEVHPNSIAQDAKGDIYVGMNAFVVRLVSDRNGYTQQWFTQRECLR
jgi:hypothetical protein